EPPDHPAEDRDLEQPVPRHVVDASPDGDRDERRVGVGLVIRGDDQRAARGDVVDAGQLETEVRAAESVKAGSCEVEQRGPHGLLAYTKKAGPDRSGPAGGRGRRRLVVVRVGLVLARYELAPEALEPVLAPNARRDFRQRLKPRGRGTLLAFDTRSVLPTPP